MRKFIDETLDKKAVVTMRHAAPRPRRYGKRYGKMIYGKIGNGIRRHRALDRKYIEFATCRDKRIVRAVAAHPVGKLSHRRCGGNSDGQSSHLTLAVYRTGHPRKRRAADMVAHEIFRA